MTYLEASRRLSSYRARIAALRRRMRDVQQRIEPSPVGDYTFATPHGPKRLRDLFGLKRELFVIHNMGSTCPYCTLWADGYNGFYEHLASRAAFVVSSPDPPAVQQRFARSRGWRFPMVSHAETTFAADMGYRAKSGGWLPGISAFRRRGNAVVRLADVGSEPGDDFCAVWHLLDLLPEGPAGWQPRLRYATEGRAGSRPAARKGASR
jgi:predicted dithiol-disulfide oxidoreductase (DUF899 family)